MRYKGKILRLLCMNAAVYLPIRAHYYGGTVVYHGCWHETGLHQPSTCWIWAGGFCRSFLLYKLAASDQVSHHHLQHTWNSKKDSDDKHYLEKSVHSGVQHCCSFTCTAVKLRAIIKHSPMSANEDCPMCLIVLEISSGRSSDSEILSRLPSCRIPGRISKVMQGLFRIQVNTRALGGLAYQTGTFV